MSEKQNADLKLTHSLIHSFTDSLRKLFPARPIPFKVMFDRFRQVLESHNKAIEIIADMGDKLGGDYIFDVIYIRDTYSLLYDKLSDSLSSFNALTQNKYPHLKNVLSAIDKEIRLHVYDEEVLRRELVLPYSELAHSMAHEVGGKNANLAELKNNTSLNIPDAFAITCSAYNEFIRHNGIDKKISALGGSDTPAPLLNEIYTSIINGSFPPVLEHVLDSALSVLRATHGNTCFLAVRSSGQLEDGEFSFAGQFETVLNVPLDGSAVQDAYKRVIASLFSDKAAAYLQQLGSEIGSIKMAVGCMVMVDAAVSGVIYSTNPNGDEGTIIVNSTWGLGTSVVEGRTDADFYVVRKGLFPEIIDKRPGKKTSMVVGGNQGGTTITGVPAGMVDESSLSSEQVSELARQASEIENYFRQPQDIEWAIDREGKIFILQARPLNIASVDKTPAPALSPEWPEERAGILMKARSQVVQKGVGAGRVFIFKHKEGIEGFLKGDILVAKNDSSDFIRIMPYASAIITDTGSLTSHMSSLCREFMVPAFVNSGNATQLLRHGQEVTVIIDDEDGMTVYDGILREMVEYARSGQPAMGNIFEFRKKRYVLRYITPLNLIDPLMEKFAPEGCKTMHDILRFIHEKAVMELIDNAVRGLKGQAARKLDLPIPAGIIVVDIGGGLDSSAGHYDRSESVTFEQVVSIPFKAILQGMMYPGAWQSSPVALTANDFMASMMRMPDIASGNARYPGSNIAVISQEYLNMNLKFGYHFSTIDCYCSEKARNNHIYFRFAGGATEIVKRSRRIELISIILKEYGFNIKTKGDLIIGRLANIERSEQENKLDKLGRLISYTRQLDAILHDDAKVKYYAGRFLESNYTL